MDAAHFRRTLADLGLSQTEAAKLLGLSRWKVVRYASGRPMQGEGVQPLCPPGRQAPQGRVLAGSIPEFCHIRLGKLQ
jgi:hypothetical protein